MRPTCKRPVAFLLACLLTATTTAAQSTPPLTKRTQAVQQKIQQLSPGDDISVIPVHGEEEYGTFTSSTPADFTFYDIDQKTNVTLRYEDVKKVGNGYGGYNSIRQRHTDRKKGLIVGIALLGVLGALLIAVAKD